MFKVDVKADLVLLVGESAISLFDYFEVDELHGLNRIDCIKRIKEGGTYIDGMCNQLPTDSSKYYLFINESAITNDLLIDFGLIFHESTHYYFRKYYDTLKENEEDLITESEQLAIEISKICLKC
jgi:hypothetical protein